MQVTVLFYKLIRRPEDSPKSLRMAEITCRSLGQGLKKRIASSAKKEALGTLGLRPKLDNILF